jgi:ribosomal protein S18 acetylase RimI-like enzyme
MKRGEEDIMRKLQNRAFFNAWGYSPNSVEELRYWIGITNTSPGNVLFCFDGDRPTGYCWTVVKVEETGDKRIEKGRIHMLGVDPDYRGKGLGKQVLLAGLSLLKSRGLRNVDLTVDSENRVSISLYVSLGFAFRMSNLWYEKKISHSQTVS